MTRWTAVSAFLFASTVSLLQVGTASAQDIRVFVIRSPDAKAVPPDAWQTFRQAIKGSAPGVTLVPSAAFATDLVELMGYDWDPSHNLGVTQTWRFFYHPLVRPDDTRDARSRPMRILFTVPGATLARSSGAAAERLRVTFRQLLLGPGPVTDKMQQ